MAKEIYDSELGRPWLSYIPAIAAVGGGLLMLAGKLQMGERFMSDGSLMMIALACYILAALFQITNLYALLKWPERSDYGEQL